MNSCSLNRAGGIIKINNFMKAAGASKYVNYAALSI